jgi:hypothetical protein
MNRAVLLALIALVLAAFTPGQGAGNTTQEKDGKQIRVQATASPTSLDFGDQVIDTPSEPLSLTLTNNTGKPIKIRRVDVGQDEGDFVVDDDYEFTDMTIDAGKSCRIGVVFYPLIPGERRSVLLITYDDPDHPQRIALRGNGIKSAN